MVGLTGRLRKGGALLEFLSSQISPRKAAGYARFSTQKQDGGVTIESQLNATRIKVPSSAGPPSPTCASETALAEFHK